MIIISNFENHFEILIRRWFEYLFDLNPNQYEDLRVIIGKKVEIHAWIKPYTKNDTWVELDLGQFSKYEEDFPGEFRISWCSFERNNLYLITELQSKSGLTEYSCNYAPESKRKEWDSDYNYKDHNALLKESCNNMGILMDDLHSATSSTFTSF